MNTICPTPTIFIPRSRGIARLLAGLIAFCLLQSTTYAFDSIALSKAIGASLLKKGPPNYQTIAFSRIQGQSSNQNINELIDFTNIVLVRQRKYRVVDRSQLQNILKEQKFNLSELISPDSYKELGQLLGVDMFLYGRIYSEELVLKAIDVETSALVWADVFPLSGASNTPSLYSAFGGSMLNSLRGLYKEFEKNKIRNISFWSIESELEKERLIDHLSISLLADKTLNVIDRENLSIILAEQKLNLENYIDQNQAKRMGELYGVDGFIYGKVSNKGGRWIASLKMLNIYNGIIEWADLLSINSPSAQTAPGTKTSAQLKDMVLIPGGIFVMGSNTGDQLSRPKHRVDVNAFYIDRYEVSNAEYEKFVQKFKYRTPQHWNGSRSAPAHLRDKPVVLVNWHDAEKYCRSLRKRLLRETEWEYAYKGTTEHTYPWGMDPINGVNIGKRGQKQSVAAKTTNKDISPFGVVHMGGNVREWIGSTIRRYPGSTHTSSVYNRQKGIRGSSWASSFSKAQSWFRDSSAPNLGYRDVGFRCAKDTN